MFLLRRCLHPYLYGGGRRGEGGGGGAEGVTRRTPLSPPFFVDASYDRRVAILAEQFLAGGVHFLRQCPITSASHFHLETIIVRYLQLVVVFSIED